MKKDKLIAMLQEIKGNPDILLWNGLVGDWMDIGRVVPHDLVKMSLPYYLEGCRLQDCCDKEDWSYQLPAEEVADLTKRWRKFPWEFNQYVTEEDIKQGKYKAKNIHLIEAKLRGETVRDCLGTIGY